MSRALSTLALAATAAGYAAGGARADGSYTLTFATEYPIHLLDAFYTTTIAADGTCIRPVRLGPLPPTVTNSGVHLRDADELLLLDFLDQDSEQLSEIRLNPATARPVGAPTVRMRHCSCIRDTRGCERSAFHRATLTTRMPHRAGERHTAQHGLHIQHGLRR